MDNKERKMKKLEQTQIFTKCGRKAPGFRHGDIRPRPSARINS